jgi:hypothetical protein
MMPKNTGEEVRMPISNERYTAVVEEYKRLLFFISRLEKAMTPQEVIDQHTADVGGFVSGIDLICTAEDVIIRAIEMIKRQKEQ